MTTWAASAEGLVIYRDGAEVARVAFGQFGGLAYALLRAMREAGRL